MEILEALEYMGDRVTAILRQTPSLQLRAQHVAELLRSCSPFSPVCACLLQADSGPHLCVLDQDGRPREAWAELLRPDLDRRERAERKRANSGKLPSALRLSGYSLVTRAIAAGPEPDAPAKDWGVLALAVPKNAPPETLSQVRALFAVCSEQLALRLQVEAQARHLKALQHELEGQSGLASTGELASPLTHEFNNFLNIVLLHVALLETEIPEKLRPELIELRRQGATMTRLVKQFQQHRRRLHLVPIPVDINCLVHESVEALGGRPASPGPGVVIKLPPSSRIEISGLGRPASVPLNLDLVADPPPVSGSSADVKRLCTFLLMNAAAAAGSVAGSVRIHTAFTDSHLLLRVEDTGPPISPDLLHQVFEPATAGRPDTNSLELAACETLVRRLHGRIRCENRLEGGVAVTVELPRMASS
jgi:signal transduction histidine kinase